VLGGPTRVALGRFYTLQSKAEPAADAPITASLVDELTKHGARVCPLECKSGETAKGNSCVADKPAPTASRRPRDDDEDEPARKPKPKRQAERERPARAAARQQPRPAARQQASRPSGGGATMIGVGF
jgi:hypothetical protein